MDFIHRFSIRRRPHLPCTRRLHRARAGTSSPDLPRTRGLNGARAGTGSPDLPRTRRFDGRYCCGASKSIKVSSYRTSHLHSRCCSPNLPSTRRNGLRAWCGASLISEYDLWEEILYLRSSGRGGPRLPRCLNRAHIRRCCRSGGGC